MGTVGNVIAWRWLESPDDATFAVVRREVTALAKAHPDGIASFHLIELPDLKFPNDDQRKKLASLRKDCAYTIHHSALLFQGDSIRTAIIRSLVTAVMLASGNKKPQVVFGTAPEAIAWLRVQLGARGPDAAALVEMVAALGSAPPKLAIRACPRLAARARCGRCSLRRCATPRGWCAPNSGP